jgi:hypothetical protein
MFASGFRYAVIGTMILAVILMAYVVAEEIIEWWQNR